MYRRRHGDVRSARGYLESPKRPGKGPEPPGPRIGFGLINARIPGGQRSSACISSRITTVIQVTDGAIKGTITDLMSHSQFHCTGRVYLHVHGLIFETSICYWQDQPGSPSSGAASPPPGWGGRAARRGPGSGGRPPRRGGDPRGAAGPGGDASVGWKRRRGGGRIGRGLPPRPSASTSRSPAGGPREGALRRYRGLSETICARPPGDREPAWGEGRGVRERSVETARPAPSTHARHGPAAGGVLLTGLILLRVLADSPSGSAGRTEDLPGREGGSPPAPRRTGGPAAGTAGRPRKPSPGGREGGSRRLRRPATSGAGAWARSPLPAGRRWASSVRA